VQPPRPADSAAAATWPHLQQYKAPRCAARRARASGVVTHLHRIRLGSLLAKRVRLILGHRHAAAAAWSGRAGGRAGCPQRDAPVPSPTGARRQRGAASAQSRCPAMETHARVPAGPAQRAGRSQHAMSGKRRAPSPLARAAVAAADRLASFLPRGILACGRALGSQALRAREITTPPARRARRPAGAVLKPSNNGSKALTKPNDPPRGGRPRTAQPGPLEHSPRPGPVRSAELCFVGACARPLHPDRGRGRRACYAPPEALVNRALRLPSARTARPRPAPRFAGCLPPGPGCLCRASRARVRRGGERGGRLTTHFPRFRPSGSWGGCPK